MFEKFSVKSGLNLASNYNKLSQEGDLESVQNSFEALENLLFKHGFTLAGSIEVSEILHSEALLCRSENFTKVIDLIETGSDLEIKNPEKWANMCTMSAGSGFRVAMLEGFSGKDVGGAIKVVISFSGDHIDSRRPIPKSDELWQTKAETAAVSLAAEGVVTTDDIKMISFRFPVRFFPESHLSEEEKDRLVEEGVNFVVRHYVPNQKTAPSYVS